MLSLLYRGFAQNRETAQTVLRFQADYNRIADAVAYIDEHFDSPIKPGAAVGTDTFKSQLFFYIV